VLDGTELIASNLHRAAVAWRPGDGLPIKDLLAIRPISVQISTHFNAFSDLTLGFWTVMSLHLYLMLLLLAPASIYQLRDIQRQAKDLRATRRFFATETVSLGEERTEKGGRFHTLFHALMLRYSSNQVLSQSSVSGRDSSRERLLLLEAVCRNMCARKLFKVSLTPESSLLTSLFFAAGIIAQIPVSATGLYIISTGRVRDPTSLRIQIAAMYVLYHLEALFTVRAELP
jgi:hypothetical protein